MTEARGPVMHRREDDGKTLIIEEIMANGAVHRTELNWASTAQGDANWEHALHQYHERNIGDTLKEPDQTQKTHRLFGQVYFTVLGGPPTWWWPHADLRIKSTEYKIMVGWLRRGFVLCLLRGPRGGTAVPPS